MHKFSGIAIFYALLLTMTGVMCACNKSYGQKNTIKHLFNKSFVKGNYKVNDSLFMQVSAKSRACKQQSFLVSSYSLLSSGLPSAATLKSSNAGNNFIHGDIAYDFYYRSAMDTPFAASNIQQHTIRTNLHFMLADKLPVTLFINTRQGNSPLFRNYTDVGVQFNGQYYNTVARQKMINELTEKLKRSATDSIVYRLLQKEQDLHEREREWLDAPAQLQQLIESKQTINNAEEELKAIALNKANNVKDYANDSEKIRMNSIGEYSLANSAITTADKISNNPREGISQYIEQNKDLVAQRVTDSLMQQKGKAARYIDVYEERKEKFERVEKEIDSLKEVYKMATENGEQKLQALRDSLQNGGRAVFAQKAKEYGFDTSSVYKWWHRLSAIKQLSIGRSMVDYSELSAKNISISGVQAIYESKVYVALATGAVDYRYRDFILLSYTPVKQYLNLVRLGFMHKQSGNLAFTFYQGNKQANFFTQNNEPATNHVFGITLEAKYRLNDDNYIIAEAAKSSYPASPAGAVNPLNGTDKAFSFSHHSNEAYAVQLFSRIRLTDTRIYGQYKYAGRNFQSFSIFNSNSDFSAWQLRADQYFLKKRLYVTASLRTADYSNPYLNTSFKTNTVFKSIQATLRIKKLPVVSVGYMPASQISSANNQLTQNTFYTFTASANHLYRIAKVFMHSGAVYSKFFNSSPDTGFIYYNARNWFIYHHITGKRLSFNSSITLSYNNGYQLLTLDQGMNYNLNQHIGIGGGIKYNSLNRAQTGLGYYGNMRLMLNRLGELNLYFDHGFLPGLEEKLRSNDYGRLTYTKTF